MPTYFAEETRDNRGGSTGKSGQKLNRGFEVVCDTAGVTAADVIAALVTLEGVFKGAGHPAYPLARCTDVKADPDPDSPFLWRAVAQYEEPAPQPGQDPAAPAAEPWDQPPLGRISFRRESVYETEDIEGRPIENSAGDLFDNPPPHFKGVPVISWTRYVEAWNLSLSEAYFNKVNSDEWNGFYPNELLIVGLDAEPVTQKGRPCWKLSFTLEVNRDGHNPVRVANFGWNVMVPDDSDPPVFTKQSAKSVYGEQLASPVKLDPDTGEALPPDADTPEIGFIMYEEISFAGV